MNYTSTMQTKTNGRSLPKGWQWVKLGDICEINPRRPALERADSTLTTFVQMSAVDDLLGVVVRPEQRPFSEIKKGYTYFAENDVIFAKITPCMENGKHAIVSDLIDGIGFGSTEFHVIRPNENIIAEWIWHFVRQPYVRQNATNYFTGAVGQQRVPDNFLKSLEIPLPPLDEQRRIASRLNEQLAAVESARKAAEEQLHSAWELPSAYLREVFENDKTQRWERTTIKAVCSIHPGQHILESDYNRSNKGIGYLTGPADFGDLYPIIGRWTEKPKAWCEPSDILVTVKGAGVGKINFAPKEKVAIGRQLMAVRPNTNKLLREFLYYVLTTHFERLKAKALGSTVPGLGRDDIENLPILLPTISEQKIIVEKLELNLASARSLIENLESQLAEINRLPASLLREAFAGQG